LDDLIPHRLRLATYAEKVNATTKTKTANTKNHIKTTIIIKPPLSRPEVGWQKPRDGFEPSPGNRSPLRARVVVFRRNNFRGQRIGQESNLLPRHRLSGTDFSAGLQCTITPPILSAVSSANCPKAHLCTQGYLADLLAVF